MSNGGDDSDPSRKTGGDPPKTPWDAKFHFDAMAAHFERRNRVLEQKMDDTFGKLMQQFERLEIVGRQPERQPEPVRREPVRRQPLRRQPELVQENGADEYEDEFDDYSEGSVAEIEHPWRRDRPRPPPRRTFRANHNRHGGADSLLNNIKTSIPEFEGVHDPDVYLDWERKVDKIFECYDFPELKKVQLASLEFRGYAASWWENQQERRRRDRYPPIDTWQEMKDVMRGRFIPVHYERELEKKLNRIKQGTRSIDKLCLNCGTAA